MPEEATFTENAAAALQAIADRDLSPAEELEVAIGLVGGLLELHADVITGLDAAPESEESVVPWATDATRLTVALENLAAVDLSDADEAEAA